MSEQQHKTKQTNTHKQEEDQTTEEPVKENISTIDDEALEDLLSDIDATLEENAEEFVKGYIQKGGE